MKYTAADARVIAEKRNRLGAPDEYTEAVYRLMQAANVGLRHMHMDIGPVTVQQLRADGFGVRHQAQDRYRVDW